MFLVMVGYGMFISASFSHDLIHLQPYMGLHEVHILFVIIVIVLLFIFIFIFFFFLISILHLCYSQVDFWSVIYIINCDVLKQVAAMKI